MNQSTFSNAIAESRAGLVSLGLCLAWAVFVFFQYFLNPSHPLLQALPLVGKVFDFSSFPPSSASQFWAIQGASFRILLTAFVISGVTWALGQRVRKWLVVDLSDSWVRFTFDFGLGLCVLNLFWIGIGLEGLWFKPLWAGVGALFFLLFVWDLVETFKRRPTLPLAAFFPKGGYLFLFLMGLFYWFFSILQNLAPETFYDSMVYHLAVPSYWILDHGIRDFPTNFFSNYPYGAEIYFLNGLVLQGTETAKMLHGVSLGACALLAGGWAREIAGPRAGWLALGLTLTLPLFAVNTWSTQVEGFLSLTVILFVYAFYRFGREREKPVRWAFMAGLFLGLALSVKYTAFLAAGIALAVLFLQKLSLLKKEHWACWGALALGSLLLLGPWVLKNLAYTGNPFFPYFMDYFSGRHLPFGGYEKLLEEQHARVTIEWWSWLLLPWTLTMSNPDSFNFCGPLSLALVPFLFLFRLRHPALRFLAGVTPLFLIAGFAVTHILRFVLPDFVLFYILLGAVLAGGNKSAWGRGAAIAAGFSAILCFTFLAAISHYYYDCAGIWSGRQTRTEYMSGPGKITPYYPLVQWVSANLPLEAHLLVVGDARGLYYDRPFLTNTVFDDQALAKIAKEERNAEGIARRLKEMGVDYLVVNGSEGIRVSSGYHHYDLTSEEWRRLDDFIQRGTQVVYFQNFQGVYRLLPSLAPKPTQETADLLLFFSKAASDFVKDVRGRQWPAAEGDLDQALQLYPFSQYWKQQKKEFETQVKQVLHG